MASRDKPKVRFRGNPRKTTLEEIREWFWREAESKGAICPCCERYGKIYKWGFLFRMAVMLFDLWRYDKKKPGKYIHVADLQETSRFPKLYQSGAKTMGYRWGLIESPSPEESEDKKCSGLWRITYQGKRFVRGMITIPKNVYIYNKEVLKFSEERITIKEACGSYSHEEMMKPAFEGDD